MTAHERTFTHVPTPLPTYRRVIARRGRVAHLIAENVPPELEDRAYGLTARPGRPGRPLCGIELHSDRPGNDRVPECPTCAAFADMVDSHADTLDWCAWQGAVERAVTPDPLDLARPMTVTVAVTIEAG